MRCTIFLLYQALLVGRLVAQPEPDIRHYALHIRPDFATGAVDLHVRIDVHNPARQKVITFELSPKYEVRAASAHAGKVTATRSGGALELKLPQPAVDDHIDLQLRGTPGQSNDEERSVIDENSLFLLWSDRFYPIVFTDWATVTTTVVLPRGFDAIAPGRLVRRTEAGDSVLLQFATTEPMRDFSVFADRRWRRTTQEKNGRRFDVLLHAESEAFRDQIVQTSTDVLDFYTQLMGPAAGRDFAFVTITGMYARRAFAGFIGYSPAYLQKEFTMTGHDAHETALLWWGHTTGGRGPGSFTWTEALGDYMEVLYDEYAHKPVPAIFEYFKQQYFELPVEQDVPLSQLRGNTPQKIVHGKYPWTMHVLRFVIGDRAFHTGLRRLFDTYRYRTFTITELSAIFEAAAGEKLDWWRAEWLERKGMPILALACTSSADAFSGCTITQEQPELYHFPMEIGLHTDQGMRVDTVRLNERVTRVPLDTRVAIRKVVLDPNHWILFKQK